MRRITIIAIFLLYSGLLRGDIIMQPYIMSVSYNSIYVLVETDNADTAFVQYGITPQFGHYSKTNSVTVTPAFTYVHKIYITGLIPKTKYFYNVHHGNSTSTIYDFSTAIDISASFKFEWMADCRTGTDVHDQISALMGQRNPLFIVNGGDVCEFQTYESWKNEYFRQNELNNISRIPFYYTPGNHEGWNTLTQTFVANPNSQSGVQDYYSFDYGDYHFLVINNYVDYASGSAQYTFIQNDLSQTTKRWKIVCCHQPPYCAGGHGNDSVMISMSENLFVPNNVDIVFSGHSHFYQRNKVGSINFMVIGCSGAPLYVPDTASFVVKSAMDYCYGFIKASRDTCQIYVYNNYDTLLDSLVLLKPSTPVFIQEQTVSDFVLNQNYPNPFNASTVISFGIKKAGKIMVRVYDISGKEIAILYKGNLISGEYSMRWDAGNCPSGIYFYKIESETFSSTRKMVLVK
jgi:predicted phosphodiesterase